MPQKPSAIHFLLLHGIVVLWGLTAIIGKSITLSGPVLVAWRTGLAAVGLGVILIFHKGAWPKPADALRMVGVGCIIGIHWFLFFLPGKIGTVSAGLVGISTISLWCALMEPFFHPGKKVGTLELLSALGVLSGAIIIGWNDQQSVPSLLWGAAAAFVAAIFAFLNGKLIQKHDSFHITFYEMLGACGIMAVAVFLLTPEVVKSPATSQDWWLLLVLSQLCTVLAFTGCTWLQKRISVYQVGLVANMEPIYGILLAALIFQEHKQLLPSFYVGSAIILACVLGYLPLSNLKEKKSEP
jgi:drug/metabolite transporter (DMT)-like permease